MNKVKIELDRKELYALIKSLPISIDEGIQLVKSGFGNFHGQNPDWKWNITQLDKISIEQVLDFYYLVKDSIKND